VRDRRGGFPLAAQQPLGARVCPPWSDSEATFGLIARMVGRLYSEWALPGPSAGGKQPSDAKAMNARRLRVSGPQAKQVSRGRATDEGDRYGARRQPARWIQLRPLTWLHRRAGWRLGSTPPVLHVSRMC
jgi:hypothetical protein